MDIFDAFRPRTSPVVEGQPLCYSVAAYRGKKRVVIAWFSDETSAFDFVTRCRIDRPDVKYDCIRSLF